MAKMTPEEKYMKEAIRQAKKAEALGEVPFLWQESLHEPGQFCLPSGGYIPVQ